MCFNVCRWSCVLRTRLWSGSWWSFTPASRSSSRNYLRRKKLTRRKKKRKKGPVTGTLRVTGEAAASTAALGKWAFPSWAHGQSSTRAFRRRRCFAGEALCLKNCIDTTLSSSSSYLKKQTRWSQVICSFPPNRFPNPTFVFVCVQMKVERKVLVKC